MLGRQFNCRPNLRLYLFITIHSALIILHLLPSFLPPRRGIWVDMSNCLLGLGSNLGNRREIIEEALAKLRRCAGIQVVSVSSLRELRLSEGLPISRLI